MPDKDSLANILLVAIAVCLVCSIVVSTAAVALKPRQEINQALDQQQNILRAAGLLEEGATTGPNGETVDELFARFEVRAVDLETGRFTDEVNVASYDPIKASKDPARSRDLSDDEDIATIGRRENISEIYLLRDADGQLEQAVIPVRGYGLWGTLYGYLAVEEDFQTIIGLGFYDQKETPGLGGEVDNPNWKALWEGVKIYGESGEPRVRLVKSRSASGSAASAYEVDALSGATLTTKGVQNLVNFWTSDLGFGKVFDNLKNAA